MKLALDEGPIGVGVAASCDQFQMYSAGIFNGTWTTTDDTTDPPTKIVHDCPNGPSDLNHAVVLVGYGHDDDSDADYFILKNTWGTGWGEQGYMRVNATERNDALSVVGIFNEAVLVSTGAISTFAASIGLLGVAALSF